MKSSILKKLTIAFVAIVGISAVLPVHAARAVRPPPPPTTNPPMPFSPG